jgi:CRISPR/Cas system-associated endonuclease Cas3-HD
MATIGQETNQRFLQNNKDIEKYLDGQLVMLKEKLTSERQKYDTIQEGKANAYTIEIERRVLQKVSTIMDESAKMRQDILARLEEQNSAAETNISNALN